MHSQTVRYARNGALSAICLYVAIVIPLLAMSLHSGPSTDSDSSIQNVVASSLSASTSMQTNR